MNTLTTAELAAQFRCKPRKVRAEASRLGLGVDLGGRAGYRYTQADVDALWEALRSVQPEAPRRRRRTA